MPQQESKIKLIIEGLGAVATFLAILIGVWQFNKQQDLNIRQEQDNRKYNDAIEFRRRTWESQQAIYLNIAETVGVIASEHSSQRERDSAIAKFKALYYGKAVFVEDSAVGTQMRTFADDVEDFKNEFLSENELKSNALDLVDSCKSSSFKTWKSLSTP